MIDIVIITLFNSKSILVTKKITIVKFIIKKSFFKKDIPSLKPTHEERIHL